MSRYPGGYGAGDYYHDQYYQNEPSRTGSSWPSSHDDDARAGGSRRHGSYGSSSRGGASYGAHSAQRRWNNNEGIGVMGEGARSGSAATELSVRRGSEQSTEADKGPANETMHIDSSSRGPSLTGDPQIIVNPTRNVFATIDLFTSHLSDYIVKNNDHKDKQTAADRLKRIGAREVPREVEARIKSATDAEAEAAKAKAEVLRQMKDDIETIFTFTQDTAVQEATRECKGLIKSQQNNISQVKNSLKEMIDRLERQFEDKLHQTQKPVDKEMAQVKADVSKISDSLLLLEKVNADRQNEAQQQVAQAPSSHSQAHPSIGRNAESERPEAAQPSTANNVANVQKPKTTAGPSRREMDDRISRLESELQEMRDLCDNRSQENLAEVTEKVDEVIEQRVDAYRAKILKRRAEMGDESDRASKRQRAVTSAPTDGSAQEHTGQSVSSTIQVQPEATARRPQQSAQTETVEASTPPPAAESTTARVSHSGPAAANVAVSMRGAADLPNQQVFDDLVSFIQQRIEPRIRQSVQESLQAEWQQFRQQLVTEINANMRELAERQKDVRETMSAVQGLGPQLSSLRRTDELQQTVLENHTVAIRRLDHLISNLSTLFAKIPEAMLPQQVSQQHHH